MGLCPHCIQPPPLLTTKEEVQWTRVPDLEIIKVSELTCSCLWQTPECPRTLTREACRQSSTPLLGWIAPLFHVWK